MENQTYSVPKGGYYMVRASMLKCEPTGRMEMVPNPRKSWWNWWEPTMITRPEYRYWEEKSGQEVQYLQAGQEVAIDHVLHRIEN